MRGTSFNPCVAVAFLLLGACGLIEAKSGQATTSALQALHDETMQLDPTVASPLAQRHARGAIVGMLAQLDGDEQQAQLRDLISTSAAAALGGIAAQDQAALGQLADLAAANAISAFARQLEDDGPLRNSMNSATRELSAAAVAGARDQLRDLFPDCAKDPKCIERHLNELTTSVSRGVAKGVFDAFKLTALALAFIGGVMITLLGMTFVRVAKTH